MIGRRELYNIFEELSLNVIKILFSNKIRPSGYTWRVVKVAYNYLRGSAVPPLGGWGQAQTGLESM